MDSFKYIVKRKHISTLFYAGHINEISNVWTTNANLATLFNTMTEANRVIDVMAANYISGTYSVRMAQVSSSVPYGITLFNELREF